MLNRRCEIKSGENLISIGHENRESDAGADTNLQKVDGFFLYMEDISAMAALYFDSFKLTKGPR